MCLYQLHNTSCQCQYWLYWLPEVHIKLYDNILYVLVCNFYPCFCYKHRWQGFSVTSSFVFSLDIHESVHRDTIMKVTNRMQLYRLTFWHRSITFKFLAHPVCKMWIIQQPKKVALWNKRHFEEKNGVCAAGLKYSVLIFVEKNV
jgi:hypothetical protein